MNTTEAAYLARIILDDSEADRPMDLYTLNVHEARTLARAVIAVSELHRPIRVYDDCGDPECLNDHVWIADTVACEDSAIGWACARCCYYGEHPLECDDHHGDHKGVPQVRACATRAALNGDDQ